MGMRVLDIGSGMGDVAMLAARCVGSTGAVVGLDIDDASVDTARERVEVSGLTNVEFRNADVATATLAENFDAVVGRLVLMHVPDPVDVLRRVAGALRPGGLVVFQEAHLESPWLSFPVSAALQQVQRLREVALGRGQPVYFRMGLALRSAFLNAGLPDPDLRSEWVVGGGREWEGFDLVEATVKNLLPGWLELGVDGAELLQPDGLAERLREEIGDHGSLTMYPLIGAWTRVRG